MQKKLIGTTALALLLSIAPFNAQASMRADDDSKVMVKPSKPVMTAQEEAKDMLTSTEYLLKSFEEAPVVARNNGQQLENPDQVEFLGLDLFGNGPAQVVNPGNGDGQQQPQNRRNRQNVGHDQQQHDGHGPAPAPVVVAQDANQQDGNDNPAPGANPVAPGADPVDPIAPPPAAAKKAAAPAPAAAKKAAAPAPAAAKKNNGGAKKVAAPAPVVVAQDANQQGGNGPAPAAQAQHQQQANPWFNNPLDNLFGGGQQQPQQVPAEEAEDRRDNPPLEGNDDAEVENDPYLRAMGDLNLDNLNHVVVGLNIQALTADELLGANGIAGLGVAIVERIVAEFRGQVPEGDERQRNNAAIRDAVNALRAQPEQPNDNGGDDDGEDQEQPQRRRVDAQRGAQVYGNRG